MAVNTAGRAAAPDEQVVEIAAAAKINLSLLVGPRRSDGYHEVFSLMLPVTLADLVRVRATPGEPLRVVCAVCPDEQNLAARAVRELERRLDRRLEVEVTITKRIPAAAGLGGGSSDAAATIVAVDRLLGLDLPARLKYEVAGAVGSDVPFFLWPGPQIAMGRGNILHDTPLPQPIHVVIAVPDLELPTAQVYAWRDDVAQPTLPEFARRTALLVNGVNGLQAPADLAALVENDLEAPVTARHPQIGALRDRLRELGAAAASMSGSGSAVFGLFGSEEDALAARASLQAGPRPPRVFYVTDLQAPPARRSDSSARRPQGSSNSARRGRSPSSANSARRGRPPSSSNSARRHSPGPSS
jgi:4-diphosphocytidyl-2-C-methyl-D-erythritol kinase